MDQLVHSCSRLPCWKRNPETACVMYYISAVTHTNVHILFTCHFAEGGSGLPALGIVLDTAGQRSDKPHLPAWEDQLSELVKFLGKVHLAEEAG